MPPSEDAWEALREKAKFCLATGIQPSEYDNLTDDEVTAFVEVINERK